MTPRLRLIVADAGPLIILSKTVGLDILQCVAAEILVPEAVVAECTADLRKPGASAIRAAIESGLLKTVFGIDTTQLPKSVTAILGNHDRKNLGERAAIALAVDRHSPVILDDADARLAAKEIPGLQVIGTARVLAEAAQLGALGKPIEQVLADMEGAGFYLGAPVKAKILALVK